MAGDFEPWIGNHNATDQQKNEYIRKLKAALVDAAGLTIESGTYTGDGTNPRTIGLTNTALSPKYVYIGSDKGANNTFVISFQLYNPSSFCWTEGAGPVINTTAITALSSGSFTVNDATYTNQNTTVYYYIAVG